MSLDSIPSGDLQETSRPDDDTANVPEDQEQKLQEIILFGSQVWSWFS